MPIPSAIYCSRYSAIVDKMADKTHGEYWKYNIFNNTGKSMLSDQNTWFIKV